LSSLLDPTRISLQLVGTDRTAALAEVARLLEGHPDIADYAGFYEALLARDRQATTSLGNGIALPHARTAQVRKTVVAVGRCTRGIPDDSGPRLRLFFVLGTPRSDPGDYLQLVSSLCRLVKDPAHLDLLLRAPTPEAFIATVTDLEDKVLGPAK
ncbi:MAG: PTS sugar transporter subunit IIA, partial [Opitutales bacterium]